MLHYCLLFLFFLNVAGAYAQEAQSSSSPSPFKVGGYVDGYYAFDFTRPPSKNRSFTTMPLRHNEFNINLGLIDVLYNADRAHGRLALHAGTYAEANYAPEPAGLQRIHEAYLGFRLGQSPWWVDMGVFGSHIGFETAISKDNWAYSRAFMADYSPFFETGLKLSGPLSDKATLTVAALNGWQNIRETNDDKAFGTQLQVRPDDRILFNWSTFFGNEMPDSVASQPRIFNDFFGQFRLSDHVDAALIFDIGLQKQPSVSSYDAWYATSFYTRYAFTPSVRLTGRLEYFADKDKVIVSTSTPNGFQTFGASVNLDYAPAENFLCRIEARMFHSKDRIFPSPSGFERNSGFIVTSFAMRLN